MGRLCRLEAPPGEASLEAVEEARAARKAELELVEHAADQADRLARVLERALELDPEDSAPCPVCRQALPQGWREEAIQRIAEANLRTTAVREARRGTKSALDALRSKLQRVPADLKRCEELGLGSDALHAWKRWESAPDEPEALIAHVEEHVLVLEDAVGRLRTEAMEKRKELHDAWQPLATQLGAWLPRGRTWLAEKLRVKDLQAAETWLKEIEEKLRNERFEPIAAQAQEIWSLLRQESSVNLRSIGLERSGNRRKVKLDVAVDDADTVALAVMSQGELNALALSLFLPRMTLPQTPFRFLVIDDPVQAMDPLKVDGLARVLAEVAKTRQVIVFTHDTRLTEAARRLRLKANIIEVRRRSNSAVETRKADDSVERHLQDARALTYSEQELGPSVTDRVIPTFCRLAIEAACTMTIRRRRIGRGESHDDVTELLGEVKTTNDLMALALFDDVARGGDVLKTLNNKVGKRATDAFQNIRRGAHEAWTGSYRDLIGSAEDIARCVERVR